MDDIHAAFIASVAAHLPANTKLGAQMRVAAQHIKQADLGRVLHAIVEPPATLLAATGKGIQGAGQAASEMSGALGHLDPLTRSGAAVPAAMKGGLAAFHNAGGLRAAALTGLGALGIYGGKRLYDDWKNDSNVPAGYYSPSGY